MPDMTTLYVHTTGEIEPVYKMHPCNGKNALALVLSDPAHAAKQFMNPVFPSERNEVAHAHAAGFRYAVEVSHPVPVRPGSGRLPGNITEVPVRRYIGRRAQARQVRQAYRAAGLRSRMFRTRLDGSLEVTR